MNGSNSIFGFLLTDSDAAPKTDYTTWIILGVIAVLVVGMLIVNMFNRNKRNKESDFDKKFLRPGDKIKTIGGIVGTITEINVVSDTEKEMVIESGSGDNKTTMTLDVNAVYVIMSRGAESLAAIEKARQEKEAAEAAKAAAKLAKKNKTQTPSESVFSESAKTESIEEAAPVAEETASDSSTEQKD